MPQRPSGDAFGYLRGHSKSPTGEYSRGRQRSHFARFRAGSTPGGAPGLAAISDGLSPPAARCRAMFQTPGRKASVQRQKSGRHARCLCLTDPKHCPIGTRTHFCDSLSPIPLTLRGAAAGCTVTRKQIGRAAQRAGPPHPPVLLPRIVCECAARWRWQRLAVPRIWLNRRPTPALAVQPHRRCSRRAAPRRRDGR